MAPHDRLSPAGAGRHSLRRVQVGIAGLMMLGTVVGGVRLAHPEQPAAATETELSQPL